MATPTNILERVKVRELAGVFHSREAMDAAVSALLSSGFDGADIDVMVGAEARERLGGVKIAVEELPEVPAPRQPVIAREDFVLVWSLAFSVVVFAGAVLAWLVVKLGGNLIWTGVAAAVGAAAAAVFGALIDRHLARKHITELEAQLITHELVLLVRVWSLDQERKAEQILRDHGARAVRPHEIVIDKRLEHLPLHSLRVDPWLGDGPLAQVQGASLGGSDRRQP
jgi:hypothetical protein